MKKHPMSILMLITSIVVFANEPVGIIKEPIKVSIANVTAIQGNRGQRPVKVMIYLSRPATEPSTVKYTTVDGSAKAGVDYLATKGIVNFEPGEAAKWITVFIIGEVAAEPDEEAPNFGPPEFIVKITESTGVIIDAAEGFIKIIQHISQNPSLLGAAGNQTIYEVIISYTGYTSFSGTAAECGIRKNGVVVLSGYLVGEEDVGSYDDIMYRGNLEMILDIDICSVKEKNNEGEHELCSITVNGSGKVYTELKVQYDSRGGYIQFEDTTGRFIRTVTGSCDQPQKDEEWTMVPNRTIASVFNGAELPMLLSRTLQVGHHTYTDDHGNITVVEVLRKIR